MPTATIAPPDDEIGHAAWWMAQTQPQWFTSGEFERPVAIGDPAAWCRECGSLAPCPVDHTVPACAVDGFHAGPCDDDCDR